MSGHLQKAGVFLNKNGIPKFDGIKIIKEPPDFMCLICCGGEDLVSVFYHVNINFALIVIERISKEKSIKEISV